MQIRKGGLLKLVQQQRTAKGFLFDMDGLIFDSERLFMEQLAVVMNEYGYELTREIYSGSCGMGGQCLRDYMCLHYGLDYPIEEISAIVENRIGVIRNTVGLTVKPEIREVLCYLYEKNIPCAVASSTNSNIVRKNLEKADLVQYFQAIIGGEMVKNSKPAPDIFLMASERITVNPKDCIVLEDSESGCIAAGRAGCAVICVPDLKYPGEEVHRYITYLLAG